MKIIPTLLTTTTDEFVSQMNLFQKKFTRIQLDVSDGKLVPNKTTQIEEMIKAIEDNKVTVSSYVFFDFHLMVQDFSTEFQKIKKISSLGMKINTVLINAGLEIHIQKLQETSNFTIGLDIFPQVQIEGLARQYNLSNFRSIQIMTVTPGFQGSPFLPEMLNKIEQLRTKDYSGEILIDGGVNELTLPTILEKKYRPDCLCVGSYLTKAGQELNERLRILNQSILDSG